MSTTKPTIETVMRDHIRHVHAQWKGDTFTSAALTKVILAAWRLKKTHFRVIHGRVRDILKNWEDQGYCEHIATTHSGNCRNTKQVIRLTNAGITFISLQT